MPVSPNSRQTTLGPKEVYVSTIATATRTLRICISNEKKKTIFSVLAARTARALFNLIHVFDVQSQTQRRKMTTREVLCTVAHKGKTQLNIELDTQRFFVQQNNFTRCTTIFRDTKQFYSVHNNFSWCKTFFHGAQQFFEIQNNFSRCTTSFRDTKQFFTVHNKLSRYKTNFHGIQQTFVMPWILNVEQNSVSQCKIKFHDAQQKFGRLVTSTGNFISCDHTASCSLPPCFVNTRATQLTMAGSLLPTGDEKEIITYYFSRGYEYDAIVRSFLI